MAKGEMKGDRFVPTNFTEHMGSLRAADKAAVLEAHQEVLGSSFEGRITCPTWHWGSASSLKS